MQIFLTHCCSNSISPVQQHQFQKQNLQQRKKKEEGGGEFEEEQPTDKKGSNEESIESDESEKEEQVEEEKGEDPIMVPPKHKGKHIILEEEQLEEEDEEDINADIEEAINMSTKTEDQRKSLWEIITAITAEDPAVATPPAPTAKTTLTKSPTKTPKASSKRKGAQPSGGAAASQAPVQVQLKRRGSKPLINWVYQREV